MFLFLKQGRRGEFYVVDNRSLVDYLVYKMFGLGLKAGILV